MRAGIWASPKQHRDQYTLFAPSLGDMIPASHPVRLLDELLEELDWSSWELKYAGPRGRPPFHPRLIAGAILYGLTKRVRSTRELEEATKVRIDFMWLLHAMTVDHSTFAQFRTLFGDELKDLFKQLAIKALKGNVAIELAVDGTRIRANSSRTGSLTAKGIERRAEQIAGELSEALEKMEQLDLLESPDCPSTKEVEKEIVKLEAKDEKLSCALEQARQRDEEKARKADKRRASSVRIPVTDPHSHVLTNKEGGYAPNYTPTATVDTASGAILVADVPEGSDEAGVVGEAVKAVHKLTGKKPERFLFDSGFAAGSNLEDLAEQGIDAYAPPGIPKQENPAIRPDPSVPVLATQWDDLPMQGKKKKTLTKEAFIYDHEKDCYHCPMGRCLPFKRRTRANRGQGKIVLGREYQCENCTRCPLAGRCLSRKAKRRGINRDQYEPYREKLFERMNTDEGQQVYKRRAPVAEGVFAHIKQAMGVRQFLLRGLDKVRIEWLWVGAAYNLKLLIVQMAQGQATENGDTATRPGHRNAIWTPWDGLDRFLVFSRKWHQILPRSYMRLAA
ncbi:MAG: IS1182 family transposase [Candidatus Nealsonbacteria bacterium]|nr:IS1182 family transposase [Candidatus Nealsonbacteria bacterium]